MSICQIITIIWFIYTSIILSIILLSDWFVNEKSFIEKAIIKFTNKHIVITYIGIIINLIIVGLLWRMSFK